MTRSRFTLAQYKILQPNILWSLRSYILFLNLADGDIFLVGT